MNAYEEIAPTSRKDGCSCTSLKHLILAAGSHRNVKLPRDVPAAFNFTLLGISVLSPLCQCDTREAWDTPYQEISHILSRPPQKIFAE